jgi:prepilin-type N-terminal cleavage/methylation domain-containing protein
MKSLIGSFKKAYTLLELAIVLIVVALLLAGAFQGFRLVQSAKVYGLARDASYFNDMIVQFETVYGSKPGDVPLDKVAGELSTSLADATRITAFTAPSAISLAMGDSFVDEQLGAALGFEQLQLSGLMKSTSIQTSRPLSGAGGLVTTLASGSITGLPATLPSRFSNLVDMNVLPRSKSFTDIGFTMSTNSSSYASGSLTYFSAYRTAGTVPASGMILYAVPAVKGTGGYTIANTEDINTINASKLSELKRKFDTSMSGNRGIIVAEKCVDASFVISSSTAEDFTPTACVVGFLSKSV